ncbi:MAG: radical SAM protein [Deltaproteobacteria bacterium]|nr:radical SAM protein [Deltaproteobacteria bacterium]
MANKNPAEYTIDMGPMGPIGEGAALMLRVNRNCPWNQCLFCPVYKGKKFASRSIAEIKRDIDAILRLADLLETVSGKMGLPGRIKREVIGELIRNYSEIYGEYPVNVTREQWLALQSLSNIANWLIHGAKRVFLQDANALFLKPGDLTEVLRYLKKSFPTIDTITSYARSKTSAQRSLAELRELKEAGLSWCFVGIESGCDDVLDFMRKGATKKDHIEGGQKLMGSGINLAAFVMPGLAGDDREPAQKHIQETIDALNEIRPTEVRVRSLAVLESAPLYAKWKSGEFKAPREDRMVEELKILLEGLTFDCTLETLQLTNAFTLKGKLAAQRETWLEQIDRYQTLPPLEKARFLLDRYLYDGYLTFVSSWGKNDFRLQAMIAEAERSLEEQSDDAIGKVEQAILAIKSKGIP